VAIVRMMSKVRIAAVMGTGSLGRLARLGKFEHKWHHLVNLAVQIVTKKVAL
jgi:hypothetical protein